MIFAPYGRIFFAPILCEFFTPVALKCICYSLVFFLIFTPLKRLKINFSTKPLFLSIIGFLKWCCFGVVSKTLFFYLNNHLYIRLNIN